MRSFLLELITPEDKKAYTVRSISLEDLYGSLGIYPGHDRFLTVLPRAVGHFFNTEGQKIYIAYDYGFLMVEKGYVRICSRAIITGASLEEIKGKLEAKLERISFVEGDLRRSVENLERLILKKLAEIERGV